MLRRTLLAGVVGATFGLAAGLSAQQAAAADAEWSYYTYFGANDKPTQLHRQFAEDVEKASDGRLRIKVYASGELPYKNSDVLKAVATNQIQMGDIAIGAVAGDVPQLNALSMPFSCTSIEKFYDAAAPAAEPFLLEVMEGRYKSIPLMQWVMPPQQLWLREPADGVENLKGLKIRAWNREQVELMQNLGSSGVTITPSEVIPALQRGVVDGAFTASVPARDWKFNEVTKFGFMMNLTLAHQVATVNKAAFDSLDADLQQLLREKAVEWAPKYKEAMITGDAEARAALIDAGMTLHDASAEEIAKLREASTSIWENWSKANGETGKKMLEAMVKACE